MKIAIQGHPTRGKEVIQILEDLGGINRMNYSGDYLNGFYYIRGDDNAIVWTRVRPEHFSIYTLEELPFKVGDEVIFPVKIELASGEITGLTYIEDKLKYEVYARTSGYHYVEPHKLSLYPMKEERNITLTLDKAKEWYKKGGELKEVALQAYSEKELNPLPRTWEEFCKNYPVQNGESWLGAQDNIYTATLNGSDREYKNWISSKKSAEAHLAMIQLEQLKNCWWNGWEPDWDAYEKHVIKYRGDDLTVLTAIHIHAFLVFPTNEMAKEFLDCFRDLIEKAGDLI